MRIIKGAVMAGLIYASASAISPQYIIDSHVHIYDPYRAGGVPWPTPGEINQPYYKTVLPDTIKAVSTPNNVTGGDAVDKVMWKNAVNFYKLDGFVDAKHGEQLIGRFESASTGGL
jgi:hypothetical protein